MDRALPVRNPNPGRPRLIHSHSAPFAGHWVFVMDVGDGTPPPSPQANVTVPLLARDTITIPAYGYMRLRWIVDSPGAWITHCHIDWHLYVGLGFVMRDGI